MDNNKISEELLSIITAVAIAATGQKVKVKRITFLDKKKESEEWAFAGRISGISNNNVTFKG